MKCMTRGVLIATAIIATPYETAAAGDSSMGLGITSDREPDNFGDPKNTKYELNGSHTFDSGLIFGGSFQYTDRTFSDRTSQNLEATIGYRVPLNVAFSVTGSAGLGQHLQQNDTLDRVPPHLSLKFRHDTGCPTRPNPTRCENSLLREPSSAPAEGSGTVSLRIFLA